MKHQLTFDPPYKISFDGGIDLLIDHVERNGRGELIASVKCWNGKPIYTDRVRISIGKKRREFAKVIGNHFPVIQDEIERMLMECELVLAERLDETRTAQDSADNEQASAVRQSQATQILKIVETNNIQLFFVPDEDKGYATLTVGDHVETHKIRSIAFRSWLARAYFGVERKAAGSQALQDAIDSIEGLARFEGEKRQVYTRLATHDGHIYWDLVDDNWRQVEISADGWRVIDAADSPVRFCRGRGMLALPAPERGGRLSDLRRFVNLPDSSSLTLYIAWLIGSLRADGRSFPILCLGGEQGSAKSTAARIARLLVDPNKAPLRARAGDERDLLVSTRNSWVIALDNLSRLTQEYSDVLCRLATGAGLSTRQLYTDEDETIFQAARPIIITAIPEIFESGDLVDRAILLELPPIPEEERREERQLWAEFEAARPALIGALCDAVSGALRNVDRVRLAKLPRMADFAKWATAAEENFAPAGAFIDAYENNRVRANGLALRASEIAAFVDRWLTDKDVKITLSDLLTQLTNLYRIEKANGGDTKKVKLPSGWPTTEKALANELRRCAPILRRFGINVSDAGLEPRTKRALRRFTRLEQSESEPPKPPNIIPQEGLAAGAETGAGEDSNELNDSFDWDTELSRATGPSESETPETVGGLGGLNTIHSKLDEESNDDLGPESLPENNWQTPADRRGSAIWRNGGIDWEVTIIGPPQDGGDGRFYVAVAESNSYVPLDQIIQTKPPI